MDARVVFEIAGKLPSGCSIVTARHGAVSTAVLVSWIQQASMEPLLISLALREGRPLAGLIEQSGRLVINLIGEDRFAQLARHFGRGFDPAEDCFGSLATRRTDHGIVLEDALGYLACAVHDRFKAGDHWLYIVQPEEGELLTAAQPYVHIRRSAANY